MKGEMIQKISTRKCKLVLNQMLFGTNPLLLLSQKSLLNTFSVSVGFSPASVNVLREKSLSLEIMGLWCKPIRNKTLG